MKNIEITKSEFSELVKGTRGTTVSSLSEKFRKTGYGFVILVKYKDEILKIKFSKKGNIIIPEEDYLRLAKEAEKRKIDKLEVADIANNISKSVYQDFENVKIEIKTIQNDINSKLGLMETLEKSIALNSKKMDKFYEETEKYKSDLKNIYQENMNNIIKQTNLIVSATKVIIDKSDKQQKYELELNEYKNKVAEYEEKSKKGFFSNFF